MLVCNTCLGAIVRGCCVLGCNICLDAIVRWCGVLGYNTCLGAIIRRCGVLGCNKSEICMLCVIIFRGLDMLGCHS